MMKQEFSNAAMRNTVKKKSTGKISQTKNKELKYLELHIWSEEGYDD